MKRLIFFVLAALVVVGSSRAADYAVGSDKTFKRLAAVPWDRLGAGDRVLIYPGIYHEKIALHRSGAPGAPIRIVGMGKSAEEVVLDGTDATTPPGIEHTYDPLNDYGLIYIGRLQGDTYAYQPSYISIENLTVRNAHQPTGHTDSHGKRRTWSPAAAGIYLCKPAHITIRGCRVEGNGNGVFSLPGTKDVRIEGNRFLRNGNQGSYREHNAYCESEGIAYINNRFESRWPGSAGTDLKDRSAGTVIIGNTFDDAPSNCLDLVDTESGIGVVDKHPWYPYVMVRNNTFRVVGRQVYLVHFGGDTGGAKSVYKSVLEFYNNTVSITSDEKDAWAQVLFKAETPKQTVRAWGNRITVQARTPGGTPSHLMLGSRYGRLLIQQADVTALRPGKFRDAPEANSPPGTIEPYDNAPPTKVPIALGAGGTGTQRSSDDEATVLPEPSKEAPAAAPQAPPTTPEKPSREAVIAALEKQIQELQAQIDALQTKLLALQVQVKNLSENKN